MKFFTQIIIVSAMTVALAGCGEQRAQNASQLEQALEAPRDDDFNTIAKVATK